MSPPHVNSTICSPPDSITYLSNLLVFHLGDMEIRCDHKKDYKITRLQDYKITRLQDYKITRLQDCKITYTIPNLRISSSVSFVSQSVAGALNPLPDSFLTLVPGFMRLLDGACTRTMALAMFRSVTEPVGNIRLFDVPFASRTISLVTSAISLRLGEIGVVYLKSAERAVCVSTGEDRFNRSSIPHVVEIGSLSKGWHEHLPWHN